MPKALSVILPVKNEGKRLAITLSDISGYLKSKEIDHEIVVVISAGSDHSVELAKRFTAGMKELKVIILKEDNGKGHAIKRGLKEAKHPWILIMNSDNSVAIVEIEKMLPYTDTNNLIVGSSSKQAKEKSGFIASFLTKFSKENNHSGFNLLDQKLAKRIVKESKIDDSSFQSELIEIAKQANANIRKLEITWQKTHE